MKKSGGTYDVTLYPKDNRLFIDFLSGPLSGKCIVMSLPEVRGLPTPEEARFLRTDPFPQFGPESSVVPSTEDED